MQLEVADEPAPIRAVVLALQGDVEPERPLAAELGMGLRDQSDFELDFALVRELRDERGRLRVLGVARDHGDIARLPFLERHAALEVRVDVVVRPREVLPDNRREQEFPPDLDRLGIDGRLRIRLDDVRLHVPNRQVLRLLARQDDEDDQRDDARDENAEAGEEEAPLCARRILELLQRTHCR